MDSDSRSAKPVAVDRYVELLCQQGCGKVNEYITALRSGQPVAGIGALDEVARQALLEELESIMAVYQCRCDDR